MTEERNFGLVDKIRTVRLSRRKAVTGSAAVAASALLPWSEVFARSQEESVPPEKIIYDGQPFDANGETLRVGSWGGFWKDTENKYLLDQLAQDFNCKVSYDDAWPWFPKFVASGVDDPPFDVANWNLPDLFKTARAGEFFVPLPELKANVPNSANLWDFASKNGLGLTYLFSQYGYAYRTDLADPPPAAFKDFWQERFADKRATYITSNTLQMVFFIMSSLAFGKDEFDIDAGVQAMKDAMPMKISDFTGNMQTLLERGEIEICVQHDGEPYSQMDRGIPVGWYYWTERNPILTQTKTVSAGATEIRKRLAYAYIDRACSAEFQQSMSKDQYLRPTNKNAVIPENLASKGIQNTAEAAELLWIPPWDWFLDNEDDIVEAVNEIFGA